MLSDTNFIKLLTSEQREKRKEKINAIKNKPMIKK